MFLETNYNPIAMSISDTASYMGIGRTAVYKLVRTGCLDRFKVGRRQLVTTCSIVAYIAKTRGALLAELADAEYGTGSQ